MAETRAAYGLYLVGHGDISNETLCFLPPIFTHATFAGNYGKTLYHGMCKYSKEPIFGAINNTEFDFIGEQRIYTDTLYYFPKFPAKYHGKGLYFFTTGIGIHTKDNKIPTYWNNKDINGNMFTPLINSYSIPPDMKYKASTKSTNTDIDGINYTRINMTTRDYNKVLENLSLIKLYQMFFNELENNAQSDMYLSILLPSKLIEFDKSIINNNTIKQLIHESHDYRYNMVKSEIIKKLELASRSGLFSEEWFKEPMGIKATNKQTANMNMNLNMDMNKNMDNFVHLLTDQEIKDIYIMANIIKYITTLTNIFYELFKIPLASTKNNNLINLFNLLKKPKILIDHAFKLVLYKHLFVQVDTNFSSDDSLHFAEYLKRHKFIVTMADILNKLKSKLITARLGLASTDKRGFVLNSTSCRGISDTESRKSVYGGLDTMLSEMPHIPKSVTKYAINNTKSENEMGSFKGRLPPHVIVNAILFPCFLYLAMDAKTLTKCGILTSHRIVFNELISTLPTFKIYKPALMAFFYTITPDIVDNMILHVIKLHNSVSAYNIYTNIINHVIYTLCSPNKLILVPYHVEDFLLIFGVIINNLLVFIDLNNAKYRDLISIQPKEYPFHRNMQHNEDYIPSKPSIWNNLPENNTISMARHNGPTNPSPKLSKKQRKLAKRLNQRNKTFKQLGRVYKHTDIITKQTILDITYRILAHNKYPYLTELVEQDPQTYIYRLLQLSEQYKM